MSDRNFSVRIAQLIIIAIPVLIFLFLFSVNIPFDGEFYVEHSVGEKSPFVNSILPEERVSKPYIDESGEFVQEITDDPTYFTVKAPWTPEIIEVELWFKNNNIPIVELGAMTDVFSQSFAFSPIQNLIIDKSEWRRIDKDGTVLLQRKNIFKSVRAFFEYNFLPIAKNIFSYKFEDVEFPFELLSDYVPSQTFESFGFSLRGSHKIKTYVKNEALIFEFLYNDLNRTKGKDEIIIEGFAWDETYEGDPSYTFAFGADDGNESDDGATDINAVKILEIKKYGLPEGVYTLNIRATSDIVIRQINTNQKKIVFQNNMNFADEFENPDDPEQINLYTDMQYAKFETKRADGVEEIFLNSNDGVARAIKLEETHKMYPVFFDNGLNTISFRQGDLAIMGEGYSAFSKEQYFNPKSGPANLRWYTDIENAEQDFVIAKYSSPETVGEWSVAKARFAAANLAKENGAYRFVISTPGIKELGGKLQISKINVTLKRAPITVKDLIREFKERIFIWNQ